MHELAGLPFVFVRANGVATIFFFVLQDSRLIVTKSGDGVVVRSDSRATGYGRHIRIDHGYGYVSLYAHMYKYNVKKNQKVKRGDLIGFVGSSGRSQAPHLHYEIWKDGIRINPINFYYGNLSAKEFNELLAKATLENQSLD